MSQKATEEFLKRQNRDLLEELKNTRQKLENTKVEIPVVKFSMPVVSNDSFGSFPQEDFEKRQEELKMMAQERLANRISRAQKAQHCLAYLYIFNRDYLTPKAVSVAADFNVDVFDKALAELK